MDKGLIILHHYGAGVADFEDVGTKLIWKDKVLSEPTSNELKAWEIEYKTFLASPIEEDKTDILTKAVAALTTEVAALKAK